MCWSKMGGIHRPRIDHPLEPNGTRGPLNRFSSLCPFAGASSLPQYFRHLGVPGFVITCVGMCEQLTSQGEKSLAHPLGSD
jgi:hypothetical protein